MAGTFDEFLDLLRISALMGQRAWRGRRVAALSNAGYEAVGMAELAPRRGLGPGARRSSPPDPATLQAALAKGRAECSWTCATPST